MIKLALRFTRFNYGMERNYLRHFATGCVNMQSWQIYIYIFFYKNPYMT